MPFQKSDNHNMIMACTQVPYDVSDVPLAPLKSAKRTTKALFLGNIRHGREWVKRVFDDVEGAEIDGFDGQAEANKRLQTTQLALQPPGRRSTHIFSLF